MKGLYTLMICVAGNLTVRTRRTAFTFQKGLYLYVGSAMGPYDNSLEARIARHLKKHKRNFWHIDYLLRSNKVAIKAVVYSQSAKRSECKLASNLENQLNQVVLISGFGSSDCKCTSHLFHVRPNVNFKRTLEAIVATYRSIGLQPRLLYARPK
jgi:endonuclease-3